MIFIDKTVFDKAKKWIKEANNYAGGGSVRHSCDNSEIYYLNRNGHKIEALTCYSDDQFVSTNEVICEMFYKIDEEIYEIYKRQFGYEI